MIDISEAEALVILSQPKFGNDCCWVPIKAQSYAKEASVGLLDAVGVRINLQVQLIYQMHPVVGLTSYKFSLFLQKPTGLDRVYQLEIKQYKKMIKSKHQLPHEHIGNKRVNGSDTWTSWGYDEALNYFTKRTNITFAPLVPHPDNFELR